MSIQELYDASGPVNGPAAAGTEGDYVDGLLDNCGLILGNIMWVIEKVTGRNPLEEILEPICGDFNSISSMQLSWLQVQLATNSIGDNYEGLKAQLPAVWESGTHQAADHRLLQITHAHHRQGQAAGHISEQMGHMLSVSKATAELVCEVINFIDSVVQEILLDLATGPFGWIKGLVTGTAKARKVIRLINRGLEAIQGLIRAIKGCVTAIKALNALFATLNTVLDFYNGVSHTDAGRHVDDTAAAAY